MDDINVNQNSFHPSFEILKNLKPSQIQSPYLNPFTLPDQISPEFIVPEGSTGNRGRFELAFSQIGASVMLGSGLGGAVGTYKGLKEISHLEVFLSVKRAQLLNYIVRNGAKIANTFGTIALTYSVIGVGLSFIQDNNDDVNTLISAVTTGTLYGTLSKPNVETKISRQRMMNLRLKRAGIGSLIGMSAAGVYILSFNRNKYFKKH